LQQKHTLYRPGRFRLRSLEDLWLEKSSQFADLERCDLRPLIEELETDCAADADELLAQWNPLIQASLEFLVSLVKLIEAGSLNHPLRTEAMTAASLVARAATLVRAVHVLTVHGLEDSARPVARSLLETLDLATVTLSDPDFAAAYSGHRDDDFDENTFWKSKIGYGKLSPRLESAWRRAGADELQVKHLQGVRQSFASAMSGAVHASSSSAFRSMYVFSLRQRGLFSTSYLGHISAHSPSVLVEVAKLVHSFSATAVRFILTHSAPHAFSAALHSRQEHSTIASGLVLQEALDERAVDVPDVGQIFTDSESAE
jgi:hypothetical protein